MLHLLLDRNDPERSYVAYGSSDTVVLFINNMGGMSTLEMGAVADEALTYLEKSANIVPVRIYSGTFMTTLNAIGFSLSLLNVTQIAQEAGLSTNKVLAFLDAPHASAAWPSRSVYPVPGHLDERTRDKKYVDVPKGGKAQESIAKGQLYGTCTGDLQRAQPDVELDVVSASALQEVMRSAATSLLESEPELTRWDTVRACMHACFTLYLTVFVDCWRWRLRRDLCCWGEGCTCSA